APSSTAPGRAPPGCGPGAPPRRMCSFSAATSFLLAASHSFREPLRCFVIGTPLADRFLRPYIVSKVANDPFSALAHPTRREIVERLSGGPATVGEASRNLGVSK